jgi:hypothetical protein
MRPSLPLTFESRTVSSLDGAETFVRSGGSGPVVVLLHGYAETSDSWAPLATELAKNYTIVVPDLRGIGRSSRPARGYDKKTQADDVVDGPGSGDPGGGTPSVGAWGVAPVGEDAVSTLQKFLNSILYVPRSGVL